MTYLLHNIGERQNSNYNTLEEILESTGPLTFDGVYVSVYEHRQALRGREVTLFVMGSYVGKDNSFDLGMPLERYCDWNQVIDIATLLGAEIGWHTWTHRDLTKLSDADLVYEVTPPIPMKRFAYPYGQFDARVLQAVRAQGFEEGWSVFAGDNSAFQRRRSYLNW